MFDLEKRNWKLPVLLRHEKEGNWRCGYQAFEVSAVPQSSKKDQDYRLHHLVSNPDAYNPTCVLIYNYPLNTLWWRLLFLLSKQIRVGSPEAAVPLLQYYSYSCKTTALVASGW